MPNGAIGKLSQPGGSLFGIEHSRRPRSAPCDRAPPALSTAPILRRNPIRLLIFGLIYLVVGARFIWPLQLPLSAKIAAATFVIVASQYHQWCRLSSGSVFSPEFPRRLVILFNWALGAIFFLALLQILLDCGLLIGTLIHGGGVSVPDGVRYTMAAIATVAAAIGVQQAVRFRH